MGLSDPHDRRTFTHYVKVSAIGTVAAIVEVADGFAAPDDATYVDVTAIRQSKRKIDLYAVAVDAKTLQANAGLPDIDKPTLAAQFRAALDLAVAAAPVQILPGVIESVDGLR